ncbi:MAG: hypothetical protein FWD64_06470 [Acidobacteriaceae bacterium]|nr:hypothetical protein [Acidobacteriaceae bacterium]
MAATVFLPAIGGPFAQAQHQESLPLPDASAQQSHRTRLILKDGSYQIVMSYRVVGDMVHYVSAERAGAEEEVPVALVDFEATRRWEREHNSSDDDGRPVLDPELAKEEADRASYTPEVAQGLRLPDQGSVFGLDVYRGTSELVPMPQSSGELSHDTGHSILKAVVNPMSSTHQLAQLKGERAAVQFHVAEPVFYLRLGSDSAPTGSNPMVVDTHGASSAIKDTPITGDSRYAIVRVDVRKGARIVASFRINALGGVEQQEDVVGTAQEVLPGGHWLKLTPRQPLMFGEYALMEVLSDREVNLGVWDFGVHPVAPENRDVIQPEQRHPPGLGRRLPE